MLMFPIDAYSAVGGVLRDDLQFATELYLIRSNNDCLPLVLLSSTVVISWSSIVGVKDLPRSFHRPSLSCLTPLLPLGTRASANFARSRAKSRRMGRGRIGGWVGGLDIIIINHHHPLLLIHRISVQLPQCLQYEFICPLASATITIT